MLFSSVLSYLFVIMNVLVSSLTSGKGCGTVILFCERTSFIDFCPCFEQRTQSYALGRAKEEANVWESVARKQEGQEEAGDESSGAQASGSQGEDA